MLLSCMYISVAKLHILMLQFGGLHGYCFTWIHKTYLRIYCAWLYILCIYKYSVCTGGKNEQELIKRRVLPLSMASYARHAVLLVSGGTLTWWYEIQIDCVSARDDLFWGVNKMPFSFLQYVPEWNDCVWSVKCTASLHGFVLWQSDKNCAKDRSWEAPFVPLWSFVVQLVWLLIKPAVKQWKCLKQSSHCMDTCVWWWSRSLLWPVIDCCASAPQKQEAYKKGPFCDVRRRGCIAQW